MQRRNNHTAFIAGAALSLLLFTFVSLGGTLPNIFNSSGSGSGNGLNAVSEGRLAAYAEVVAPPQSLVPPPLSQQEGRKGDDCPRCIDAVCVQRENPETAVRKGGRQQGRGNGGECPIPAGVAIVKKSQWEFLGVSEHSLIADDSVSQLMLATLDIIQAFILATPALASDSSYNSANHFGVNLGANDGKSYDPMYPLFVSGWSGIAVELRDSSFQMLVKNLPWPRVVKLKQAITPSNIVDLLRSSGAPAHLDIVKIDIDSYDIFVLEALLRDGTFEPKILVMEINEKVPPPVCYSLNYHRKWGWAADHHFGCSLSMALHILKGVGYQVVALNFNNLILASSTYCGAFLGLEQSPAAVYQDGYWGRTQRAAQFPWNSNVDKWVAIAAEDPYEAMRDISDFMFATESYKSTRSTFALFVDPNVPDTGNHSNQANSYTGR